MEIDRRELLVGAAALALGCAGDTPSEPVPGAAPRRPRSAPRPQPELPLDGRRFPWGVVVGDVTQTEAHVRVRLVGAGACDVVVQVHDGQGWVEHDRVAAPRGDFTCALTLEQLEADGLYAIWAEHEGVRSQVTRFRTAPREGGRVIRFGATSCMAMERDDMPNLHHVDAHDLDFFALLGDTVYADGSRTVDAYRASWSAHLARPAMPALFASTSLLATWDDHEVDNNWVADALPPGQLEAATQVMREILPMQPPPLYRSRRWGDDLELFVLDCRGERGPQRMISDEQLAWLVDGLAASDARFKCVLASVHVTDHYALLSFIQESDRWQGYPAQRAELVAALRATPGVFVITGDMHFGSVQFLDPAGGPGEHLVEVAAGPSGSRRMPVLEIAELRGGLPDAYVLALPEWNWTRFELDPALGEVRVRFIGDDGDELASHVFRP